MGRRRILACQSAAWAMWLILLPCDVADFSIILQLNLQVEKIWRRKPTSEKPIRITYSGYARLQTGLTSATQSSTDLFLCRKYDEWVAIDGPRRVSQAEPYQICLRYLSTRRSRKMLLRLQPQIHLQGIFCSLLFFCPARGSLLRTCFEQSIL